MNTYDFDQTIYEPDSSLSFYLFCLKKYPSAVLRTLPKTLAFAAAYGVKKMPTKRLKEQLFSFLRYLPDVDAAVEILEYLGCRVTREGHSIRVDPGGLTRNHISREKMQTMR